MTDASQSSRRNWQLMILLEQVPEFQEEVKALRRTIGVRPHGIITDHEKNPLRNEHDRIAEEKANREADSIIKRLGAFAIRPLGFGEIKEMSDFQREIFHIGDKFRLPYNLYAFSTHGIAWYVLRNRVSVQDQNWMIDTDVMESDRSTPMRWASIRAFLPLDDKEAKEAIAELNATLRQKEHMPEALTKPRRIHENTEQHLFEVVEMLEAKPQDAGDRIAKSDRERLLLDRADSLAKDLFGYGIKSDTNEAR